jgi:nucleoside-diphosphate-sugar epimerase
MIFVTGATGLLGSQLVRNLVAKGEKVIALKRKRSDLSLLEDAADQIEWVEGDVCDIESLDEGMKKAEKVFHCAALISFQKKDRNALYKTNVEGTANVMNAALANNVKRVVHVSSVAAFGFPSDGKIIHEKTLYSEGEGLSYYFKSKHYGEREVWRAHAEGLDVVIANPSTILGGGRWHVEPNIIFPLVHKGLPFYSSGSNGFVDVRDAAKALEILMERAESGTQFIISAANLTIKELIDKIADKLQAKKPFLQLYPLLAKTLLFTSGLFSMALRKKPLLTSEQYRIASECFRYDNSLFTQTFSYRFIPLEQTLKDCVEAYKKSLEAGKKFSILR